MSEETKCQREYDFALVIDGVTDLDDKVMDALFEAGCDDATFGIVYGHLYAEFSREADSMQDAILTAIHDIRKANIGAIVLRIDDCNFVTQAEIARRIDRSRQLVNQYITGAAGPGNFPPPGCHLAESSPLWAWCEVSQWLAANNIIRPEVGWDAEVVAAINMSLEISRQQERHPSLFKQISRELNTECPVCS